ncbi:MAG: GTP cyclohydrolase II [Proteobacteria bacterium]|nr:GTP cyclohydrolase II [Pseudomonadota bacterium]
MRKSPSKKAKFISLTSHPGRSGTASLPIHWGEGSARQRGPVIGSLSNPAHRNVIGSHSGSYAIYRALAVATGALDPERVADLTDTSPTSQIGPHEAWRDPTKIVSIDAFGAVVGNAFSDLIAQGYDIRPTIAITRAKLHMPEIQSAQAQGRLQTDGVILCEAGECAATKIAIEPVWHLPGVARRFDIEESLLRHTLFQHTAGMFPELVTRNDLQVFLPPIGGMTVYLFGEVSTVADPSVPLTVRVHDECNGSDVFGSDICTCRPYLAHGVEACIRQAQLGGNGVIVYNRKEGRALGEVTKFLVYNARKRQAGGDRAEAYFERTECVAGVEDMRFQELMPDVLHWLGVRQIDQLVSMSSLKHEAITRSGISVVRRLAIPKELVPPDAHVEIDAKRAAGYYWSSTPPGADPRKRAQARSSGE